MALRRYDVRHRHRGCGHGEPAHDACANSCYSQPVDDTSTEAARVQAAVHRRMGEARRFAMACRMSDEMRSIALSRIRSQHPEFDEVAVKDQLVWELYGVRLRR